MKRKEKRIKIISSVFNPNVYVCISFLFVSFSVFFFFFLSHGVLWCVRACLFVSVYVRVYFTFRLLIIPFHLLAFLRSVVTIYVCVYDTCSYIRYIHTHMQTHRHNTVTNIYTLNCHVQSQFVRFSIQLFYLIGSDRLVIS